MMQLVKKKELILYQIYYMTIMRKIFAMLAVLLFSASIGAQDSNLSYYDWVDKSAQYIDVNRLDSAAFALQQAMKLEPSNNNNPVLLLNLGIMQRQLRMTGDAYVSLTAALANNPDPVLVLHNRASLLCDISRFDEAMDDYTAIIKLDPINTEAYYRRGLLYLEANKREAAEADFKKCEEIDAEHLFSKLSKALLLKLEDDWEGAEKIYTDIIKTEERKLDSYYMNRAECYVNIEKYSLAANDLRVVEVNERDNPYFYILRGRVRLNQFDKFAAKLDFEKAKQLGYDEELADKWIERAK